MVSGIQQERFDLIQVAKSLYEDVDSAAEKIEEAGTLPPEVVDLLKSKGMFDFMVPRELGGAEVEWHIKRLATSPKCSAGRGHPSVQRPRAVARVATMR